MQVLFASHRDQKVKTTFLFSKFIAHYSWEGMFNMHEFLSVAACDQNSGASPGYSKKIQRQQRYYNFRHAAEQKVSIFDHSVL